MWMINPFMTIFDANKDLEGSGGSQCGLPQQTLPSLISLIPPTLDIFRKKCWTNQRPVLGHMIRRHPIICWRENRPRLKIGEGRPTALSTGVTIFYSDPELVNWPSKVRWKTEQCSPLIQKCPFFKMQNHDIKVSTVENIYPCTGAWMVAKRFLQICFAAATIFTVSAYQQSPINLVWIDYSMLRSHTQKKKSLKQHSFSWHAGHFDLCRCVNRELCDNKKSLWGVGEAFRYWFSACWSPMPSWHDIKQVLFRFYSLIKHQF